MTETASAAGIHTGDTARSPYWSQKADRVFYVTIKREGKGHAPLLGPYETHQEALDNVDRGNRLACVLLTRGPASTPSVRAAPRDRRLSSQYSDPRKREDGHALSPV